LNFRDVLQATTNVRFTMPGSKTNVMNRSQVLAAVRAIQPSNDFLWDGVSEDDRPATSEELQAGVAANRKRGRPAGSATTRKAIGELEAGKGKCFPSVTALMTDLRADD
jgi:hypothetical protein